MLSASDITRNEQICLTIKTFIPNNDIITYLKMVIEYNLHDSYKK